MQENYTTLNNKSDRFEHELILLKHLKGVSDLQSVAKLQNKTEHLEQEPRNTNNKVSSLTNDGTSRKQDFIALLNKIQSIEQKTNTLELDIMSPLLYYKESCIISTTEVNTFLASIKSKGSRSRDRVGFTTTYENSAYHR